MGFILRFQWWLLSKKVTSLLYWKWHHAHTSIGDGRKCQYRSNGRRHKGFKSKSLSKTSCLLESRMLDEATVPLCLPRKGGKTQAILQSSETAGWDTAAKEKRRSNSLNISTNASFSIWKAQCHRVSNSRARELKTDPKKSEVIFLSTPTDPRDLVYRRVNHENTWLLNLFPLAPSWPAQTWPLPHDCRGHCGGRPHREVKAGLVWEWNRRRQCWWKSGGQTQATLGECGKHN